MIFIGLVFWGVHYKVGGKPLYKVAQDYIATGDYKEGFKDLRTFLGGFLKTMGEQIQEDVSDKDKKQLDKLIQDQLKNNGYKEIKK